MTWTEVMTMAGGEPILSAGAPAVVGLLGGEPDATDRVAGALERLGYRRVAFADKPRQLAERILGTAPSPDAVDEVRDAARAVLGDHVWIDACLPRVSTPFGRAAFGADERIVVVDVQDGSEARRIRNLGGVVWGVADPGRAPTGTVRPDEVVLANGSPADLVADVRSILERDELRQSLDVARTGAGAAGAAPRRPARRKARRRAATHARPDRARSIR